MDDAIRKYLKEFFSVNANAIDSTQKITKNRFDVLDNRVKEFIPDWYKELLSDYPISKLEIQIPFDFGQPEFIGKPIDELPLLSITMNDLDEINEEMIKYFPGNELIKINYLCIAIDNDSTQEGIYINTLELNPPLLLVFHDLGKSASELIENAAVLLNQFSDLFKYGKI